MVRNPNSFLKPLSPALRYLGLHLSAVGHYSDVFADVIYRFANHITSTTGSGRDGLGVSIVLYPISMSASLTASLGELLIHCTDELTQGAVHVMIFDIGAVLVQATAAECQ